MVYKYKIQNTKYKYKGKVYKDGVSTIGSDSAIKSGEVSTSVTNRLQYNGWLLSGLTKEPKQKASLYHFSHLTKMYDMPDLIDYLFTDD